MCLQLGHGGQRAVDGFARRVGLLEAVRHSPSEDRSHPLTHPTGCLRPGRPYRGEDLQYTPGGLYGPEVYCPESAWRDAQESVSSLRCAWRCATGYVRLMDDMGGFLERRHWRPLLLGQKITTFRNRGPVVQRLLASSGEAYGRKSAQSDIATASVDGDPLDPGLASRFADEQVQTTVVGVSPRFLESPDTSRR